MAFGSDAELIGQVYACVRAAATADEAEKGGSSVTENDETQDAGSEEVVEIAVAELERLRESEARFSDLWLRERERGQRTVVGLIRETQSRLLDLASLQKPGPHRIVASSMEERLRLLRETRLLPDEAYKEVLDLQMLLNDAIDLLGAGDQPARSENEG
jgi:hypothetical protein